jgi:hypothetical protein
LTVVILRKVFLAACLAVGLFNFSCSSSNSTPNEPARNVVNELKQVCGGLPAIPDSTVINKEESNQPDAVVYTTVFESGKEPEEVEQLFLKSLTASGWENSIEHSADYVTSVKFRKNEFTVVLDYYKYQFMENNKYTVKCSWEKKQS